MTPNWIRTAVVDAIAELAGLSAERICDADELVEDLGVDSMLAVSLLVAIEDRVGIALPDGCEGSLVGAQTVGDLAQGVASVLALDVGQSRPANAQRLS
jgi:acyl carrier protein